MSHDLINIVTNQFFEGMVIWEWLAEITPSGWSAIASFITAFATISIVCTNHTMIKKMESANNKMIKKMESANNRMIEKMEEDIKERNRPFIIMYVSVEALFAKNKDVKVNEDVKVYMLNIKNTGRSLAENVELNLDKDFFQYANNTTNLRKLDAFKGIPFNLPPKSDLNFPLGWYENIFGPEANQELCPDSFKIEAKYTYKGIKYRETTVFNLKIHKGCYILNPSVGWTLKEIRNSINELVDKVSTPK